MNVLQDRVIVLTGASRGLGEAMAVGLAAEGAALVLAARTVPDLQRVAERCTELGAAAVLSVGADVTMENDVKELFQVALEKFGRIDAFVANAGVSPASLSGAQPRSLKDYDFETVQRMFAVNSIGVWLCMKEALAQMGTGGSFIAIGSGMPGSSSGGMLSVTKGCVDMLVALGAGETDATGVRVNCLAPGGMVNTHLFGPNKMPERLRQLPMSHEPEIIVPAAVWLASSASAGVNGAQLTGVEFNAIGAQGILAKLGNQA